MEKNVSKVDRTIRGIVGLAALALSWIYSPWFLIIAVIALATAAMGKCPVYAMFKKKSKPVVKKATKKKK